MNVTRVQIKKHPRARGTSQLDLRTPSGRPMAYSLAILALGVTWALSACSPSPDPVQACTDQIVYNIQHSPNVYGACDGLTDAQIKAASDAAIAR